MAEVAFELDPDRPTLGTPVLVHGLSGLIDAGGATRLAIEHILETCEHSRVATFDVDGLYDYRERRPRTIFDSDHYSSMAMPEFAVDAAVDMQGEQFLVLHGMEPNLGWSALANAIISLMEELRVRLVVGMQAIPWPAPHTRPVNVTVHANDSSLIGRGQPWMGSIEVPGSLAALLELRLGARERPAMGFAAHVPHYLVGQHFPRGAVVLLQSLSSTTGLSIPLDDLRVAADEADADFSIQIAANPDNQGAVELLEAQYDSLMSARAEAEGAHLAPPESDIAAQVEAFLAQLDGGESS